MGVQYQDFLLDEFRNRRSRNPNYSLRAFARDLGMPASKLSQNLRGLCGISVAKAEVIADKIQLREDDRRLFLALVEAQHARSRVAKQQASAELAKIAAQKLNQMPSEKFAIIRDWYHLAILELVEIKGFKADPIWIGSRLDLPVELVREAIARLVECGLLLVDEEKWRQTHRDLELPSGPPSRQVREHHRQLLTKAGVALEEVSVDEREFSSQTFAVDRALVGELKTLIRDFQRQVAKLASSGTPDEVYALTIQLFPLLEKEG